MSNSLEDDLDSIYRNIIHLIYKGNCVFKDHDIQCEGELSVVNVISKKNKYFRWDLNNGVLFCETHKKWWSDNRNEPYQLLHLRVPYVGEFHLVNQSATFELPIDLGQISAFLRDHANECIKKAEAPFPSIHGRLDVI